jgi:hypothetical protein
MRNETKIYDTVEKKRNILNDIKEHLLLHDIKELPFNPKNPIRTYQITRDIDYDPGFYKAVIMDLLERELEKCNIKRLPFGSENHLVTYIIESPEEVYYEEDE